MTHIEACGKTRNFILKSMNIPSVELTLGSYRTKLAFILNFESVNNGIEHFIWLYWCFLKADYVFLIIH